MKKLHPLQDRIIKTLKTHDGRSDYWTLMEDVFPSDEYPNAFRQS